MHDCPHPLAGKTARIRKDVVHLQFPDFGGSEIRIEDWWDRVSGKSWMVCNGNPACMVYAMRSAMQKHKHPIDNEVVYGKAFSYGHLVHVSELEDCQTDKTE